MRRVGAFWIHSKNPRNKIMGDIQLDPAQVAKFKANYYWKGSIGAGGVELPLVIIFNTYKDTQKQPDLLVFTEEA